MPDVFGVTGRPRGGKQNIRRRKDTDNDEEDQNSDPVTIINTKTVKNKESKKDKSVKKTSLLSFGDDEEELTIKVKKSSRSKRIAKQIKKQALEEREENNLAKTVDISAKIPNKPIEKDPEVEEHHFRPKTAPSNGTNHLTQSSFTKLNSGSIPTSSMIHAARKQREMLRKFGSEHIPINDAESVIQSREKNSRLVREDDNDISSDEEAVVAMKGVMKSSTEKKMYVPTEEEDKLEDADDQNDEEVNRWEEEVIRKGINSQQVQSSAANQNIVTYGYCDYYDDTALQHTTNTPYSMPQTNNNLTFASVKKRLKSQLASLKEGNENHHSELDQLIFDRSECEHISNHLNNPLLLSSDYQFYQEMKQYVQDLFGCLCEKVVVISYLEQGALKLWKTRTERLISRRVLDMRDESAQSSASFLTSSQDGEMTKRTREREARRTRRRAERQIKERNVVHYDGTSTDDEDTTMDLANFNAEVGKIDSASKNIFDDVVEDFCYMSEILKRFSEWREKHWRSYNDAYIALCIPKIVTPFVRKCLILWNPLLSNQPDFEHSDWFKEIAQFGLNSKCDNLSEEFASDDSKILQSVVEKVFLSKLSLIMVDSWDPLSEKQTTRVVTLLNHLMRDYSFFTVENTQCKALVKILCKRLQTSLDNDVFIPLLPLSGKKDAASLFLERQTWSCIKLFKNIMMLNNILSFSILCEMAFDSLLNRYIMLALQTSILNESCLYKCKEIVFAIPESWFKTQDISTYLKPLVKFLSHFGESIRHSNNGNRKMLIKEITNLLNMLDT